MSCVVAELASKLKHPLNDFKLRKRARTAKIGCLHDEKRVALRHHTTKCTNKISYTMISEQLHKHFKFATLYIQ